MQLFKLVVYIPEPHTEVVKAALFQAGAGRIGNYDCCAWQTSGTGQFRPLGGSNPFVGQQGEVEAVVEDKLELVCTEKCLEAAIDALHRAHPYETPAYQSWPVNGAF
mgnify:FL=1